MHDEQTDSVVDLRPGQAGVETPRTQEAIAGEQVAHRVLDRRAGQRPRPPELQFPADKGRVGLGVLDALGLVKHRDVEVRGSVDLVDVEADLLVGRDDDRDGQLVADFAVGP